MCVCVCVCVCVCAGGLVCWCVHACVYEYDCISEREREREGERDNVKITEIIYKYINKVGDLSRERPESSFSIATTPRFKGGRYSIPRITPLPLIFTL